MLGSEDWVERLHLLCWQRKTYSQKFPEIPENPTHALQKKNSRKFPEISRRGCLPGPLYIQHILYNVYYIYNNDILEKGSGVFSRALKKLHIGRSCTHK
jgi:hypothetical protein